MHRGPHRSLIVTLVAALSTVGWAYRDSFLSMAQKWSDDAAFSHGFLVLPISLWLVWQKRTELAAVPLIRADLR